MKFDDHQRGVRDGYSGTPTAPPKNIGEAMGRTEGPHQRLADDMRTRQASEGYTSAHLPLRFVPVAMGVLVAWMLGARLTALLLLAAGLLGLAAAPRLRWLLRQATPVYIGVMLGVCMSSVSLMFSQAPLVADNLLIFPGLGALAGAVFTIVRRLLGRRRH